MMENDDALHPQPYTIITKPCAPHHKHYRKRNLAGNVTIVNKPLSP